MLESRVLLIRPWHPPPGGGQPRLRIADALSGAPLGFACRQPECGLLSWVRWLRQPCLAVHEAIDEPLLCLVRRALRPWPTWRVRDADGTPVGLVAGNRLLVQDELLATLQEGRESSAATYQGKDGRELAATTVAPEGVRLAFL